MTRLWIAASLLAASPLFAQSKPFTLYYQNVPLWSEETALSQGGLSDFNRFRVMTEPAWGRLSFRVAYEQVATVRQYDTELGFVGFVPSGGEWLDLQWTIEDDEHFRWAHRFDRLEVSYQVSDALELTAGRQAVSWATTLFLTPADPFSPFSPADPFREFRAGVDAARVRVYPGPLSEIDIVVRPTDSDGVGEELTALARGLMTVKGWEVSGWGGSLYGDVTGAVAAAGAIGSWALRGESTVRGVDGDVRFRGTIGIDHQFRPYDRDLFLVAEYQYDGLGAASPDDYVAVLQSDAFLRGELQVLGRHETAVQASYQIHPLGSVAALVLWNVSDGSLLLAPSFAYSLSNEASLTGGVFFGFGDNRSKPSRPLPSEYGLAGVTAYASVSLFF